MTSSTGWLESSPMPLLLQSQMILRSKRVERKAAPDMTANDRRFLRSLRIASDEQPKKEEVE